MQCVDLYDIHPPSGERGGWCSGIRVVQIWSRKTARIRQKLTWQSPCRRGGEWIIDNRLFSWPISGAHRMALVFVYCLLHVVIGCIHWSLMLIFELHMGFEDIGWIFLISSHEAVHKIKCHCDINIQSDHACYFVYIHKKTALIYIYVAGHTPRMAGMWFVD